MFRHKFPFTELEKMKNNGYSQLPMYLLQTNKMFKFLPVLKNTWNTNVLRATYCLFPFILRPLQVSTNVSGLATGRV